MAIKNRKSTRLKNYDYTQSGYYFVTVCVQNRECRFGNIINGEMVLNEFGKIVEQQWKWLKQNFNFVDLDVFIVMPNHFHGILIIEPVGNGLDRSLQPLPIFNIIGAFKTTSSKLIHNSGLPSFSWQKSFYDHVIRRDESLNKIREYIVNNPLKWDLDRENPRSNG
ncbi:MAG: transposase [Parcubacteria group bacterium]